MMRVALNARVRLKTLETRASERGLQPRLASRPLAGKVAADEQLGIGRDPADETSKAAFVAEAARRDRRDRSFQAH